ncbi:MAG TPA: phosphotransferase [Acidimicrobiales bacterium]
MLVRTPVPRQLEELLDPTWLTDALADTAAGERVVAVEQADSVRTLAEKVRFTVTFERPGGERRVEPYCVKGHFDDSPNTLMPETRFYRELRPLLDVRTPRAHYTGIDEESGRSLIIMDDVVARGGRFLSAHTPYNLATCRDSLEQLARLHAATWGDDRWNVDWLRPRIASMRRMYATDRLQQLLDDGRGGPDMPADLRDAHALVAAMDKAAEAPATCVIHGDTHSGNVYLDAEGRASWLDWQVTQRGHWSTDVSYHIATVLDIEDRRAHEADLLRHYLDALRTHGVTPPPWDEAWERYTLGFVHGWFLWVITQISSRAVVLIHIPRLAAALTDHRTFRRLGVV